MRRIIPGNGRRCLPGNATPDPRLPIPNPRHDDTANRVREGRGGRRRGGFLWMAFGLWGVGCGGRLFMCLPMQWFIYLERRDRDDARGDARPPIAPPIAVSTHERRPTYCPGPTTHDGRRTRRGRRKTGIGIVRHRLVSLIALTRLGDAKGSGGRGSCISRFQPRRLDLEI